MSDDVTNQTRETIKAPHPAWMEAAIATLGEDQVRSALSEAIKRKASASLSPLRQALQEYVFAAGKLREALGDEWSDTPEDRPLAARVDSLVPNRGDILDAESLLWRHWEYVDPDNDHVFVEAMARAVWDNEVAAQMETRHGQNIMFKRWMEGEFPTWHDDALNAENLVEVMRDVAGVDEDDDIVVLNEGQLGEEIWVPVGTREKLLAQLRSKGGQ